MKTFSGHTVECSREVGEMTVRVNGRFIMSAFQAKKAQEIAIRIFEAIQAGEPDQQGPRDSAG